MTRCNETAIWSSEARARRAVPPVLTPLRVLALDYARGIDPNHRAIMDRALARERTARALVETDLATLINAVASEQFPEHEVSRRNCQLRFLLNQADVEAQRYFEERNQALLREGVLKTRIAAESDRLDSINAQLRFANVPLKLAGRDLTEAGRVKWLADELEKTRAQLLRAQMMPQPA